MRRLFVLLIVSLVGSAMVIGPADAKDPKNPKKAKKQITDAYSCFLEGSLNYTYEQKGECVAKVADDEELLALLQETGEANAASAAMTSFEIVKIKFKSEKKAAVDFNLVIGGQVLEGVAPPGGAVLVKDDGKKVWKVSALTFCNLTSLANSAVATSGPCADIIATDTV
jgi:hypothetical protein